jgi:lipopolysaccharide/colanic/teichoic acid biosynthesis glycosyltransferase
MTPLGRVVKRAMDLSSATAGLFTLSPLLAAISVAIKLDSPGPVLFRQQRLGLNGIPFTIFKFRTMQASAGVSIDSAGNVLNSASDGRHTRVGRVLRRYSLDELPQLINVVRGDMSLVGPRPDLPEALSFYTPDQRRKLSVRPGITGLAQVSGRNSLDAREKWSIDSEYSSASSLLLDARILAHTLTRAVSATGIYQEKPQ